MPYQSDAKSQKRKLAKVLIVVIPMLASWLCFWNWAYNFLFQLCSKSCIIGLNSVGSVYPYEGPHPKEIEILTEGMDTLSSAQYLKALSHFDYAREYAERALAENPGSFEALLLYHQANRTELGKPIT